MAINKQSNRKLCAWITRHHPTRKQHRDLRDAGYNVRFIPTREKYAISIMHHIKQNLNTLPDLIVAAHPISTLHHLARVAHCPVIIADMDYSYRSPKWEGTWRQVIKQTLITKPFITESEAH